MKRGIEKGPTPEPIKEEKEKLEETKEEIKKEKEKRKVAQEIVKRIEREGESEKSATEKLEQAKKIAALMEATEGKEVSAMDVLHEEALEENKKREKEKKETEEKLRKERMKELIQEIDFQSIESLPEKLASNKEFALLAIERVPLENLPLSSELFKDPDFVLEAMGRIRPELLTRFVEKAIKINPRLEKNEEFRSQVKEKTSYKLSPEKKFH